MADKGTVAGKITVTQMRAECLDVISRHGICMVFSKPKFATKYGFLCPVCDKEHIMDPYISLADSAKKHLRRHTIQEMQAWWICKQFEPEAPEMPF